MAELHLTDLDDVVLARLQERARQQGMSLEENIRRLLKREAEKEPKTPEDVSETLRMPSPDRSFQTVDPVQASGIPASTLLIRDRDR